MIELSREDRLSVVRWLSGLTEFETESGRRRLLDLAGLGSLGPQIDVGGAPLIAAATTVEFLARYGRIGDAESLGLMLNLASSLVGAGRQEEIDGLVRRYGMSTPTAVAPRLADAEPGIDADALNEKIIGQNTLRSMAFIAGGMRAARAVGLVTVRAGGQPWTGSGFLIAPDRFITNHHVIESDAHAEGAVVTFNFEEDENGSLRTTSQAGVEGLLASNPELDYSILRLKGHPGEQYGWLDLSGERAVKVGDRVNIIQHPGGQPKQIALQQNLVEYVDASLVQYITSTLPGSSGSPVLDDTWNPVALHHAGGQLVEPMTGSSYYRNEGISIAAIVDDLPAGLLAGDTTEGSTP